MQVLYTLEILTDQGTQFMNQTPRIFEEIITVVEWANNEVNRQIRNILADEECKPDWPQVLCMPEKLLSSSVNKYS